MSWMSKDAVLRAEKTLRDATGNDLGLMGVGVAIREDPRCLTAATVIVLNHLTNKPSDAQMKKLGDLVKSAQLAKGALAKRYGHPSLWTMEVFKDAEAFVEETIASRNGGRDG